MVLRRAKLCTHTLKASVPCSPLPRKNFSSKMILSEFGNGDSDKLRFILFCKDLLEWQGSVQREGRAPPLQKAGNVNTKFSDKRNQQSVHQKARVIVLGEGQCNIFNNITVDRVWCNGIRKRKIC